MIALARPCYDGGVRPWLLALAAALTWPQVVSAHPAPAVDANNRYLKITPMADRARLAYTIYFGEVPGNVVRRALDVDGDGTVSDDEAARWSASLAQTVQRTLALRLDDREVALAWEEVVPGLGSAHTDGGAFAVDLIAWMCAASPGRRHELELIDRHSLLPAGETEVRIDESPGVQVDVARVGDAPFVDRLARFQGEAAPLARGLHLVWEAGPRAEVPPDDRCPRPRAAGAARGWLMPMLGAGVGLALIARVIGARRRRGVPPASDQPGPGTMEPRP